eukprot:1158262-Pelagomonas_calceolata.AAC.9
MVGDDTHLLLLVVGNDTALEPGSGKFDARMGGPQAEMCCVKGLCVRSDGKPRSRKADGGVGFEGWDAASASLPEAFCRLCQRYFVRVDATRWHAYASIQLTASKHHRQRASSFPECPLA